MRRVDEALFEVSPVAGDAAPARGAPRIARECVRITHHAGREGRGDERAIVELQGGQGDDTFANEHGGFTVFDVHLTLQTRAEPRREPAAFTRITRGNTHAHFTVEARLIPRCDEHLLPRSDAQPREIDHAAAERFEPFDIDSARIDDDAT
ncbi:MAG: hypothetical protein QM767_15865 [Anaeromyxobacter sp.]